MLELLAAVAGLAVWVFCATRVMKIMQRRCDLAGHYQEDCSHEAGLIMGWIFGPFMYVLVVAYQLADGTTVHRFGEWRAARREMKANNCNMAGLP